MGFTLDVDLKGAGSSLSLNGGKTDITADYKAVGQQSGIFTGDGGFDLDVGGKTTLIGGAITTTDAAVAAGLNNYVSKGGIVTQDIENTTSYEGDAIQVGVSLGMTDNKPQGNTNGLGYGTDSDSDGSTTKAGITGIAGNSGITTDNRDEYAGALENGFDAERVNEELGAQTIITKEFDQERRKIKTDINKKEQGLRAEAEEQGQLGNNTARDKLIEQADKVQKQGLLFDAVSGAIYGPNTNGVTGYVAKAASPFVSNQIGQYFKQNAADNKVDKGNRLEEGSSAHLLAHTILGAAVSYATGNDVLSGGIAAGTGEVTAPLLSQYLYKTTDSSKLTAEQKDTISAITSALGAGIGLTTGNASDAANAAETTKVAVDNNHDSDLRVDKALGREGKSPFSNNEALAIKAVIGTVVWPVGVLEAYLAADNDAEKLAILKTAFSPLKARALLEVLENTQVAKSRANKAPTQTANKANNTCSFRGDMLVRTISGYRPISEVRIGNMVLSKNEITGKLTYQSVSNHYDNSYNATVYITIKDSNGNTQTIVSNKIHPFFTQVNTGAQLPQSSEGHNYQGNIDNAQWIDASNLKAGYQLLSENGQWQVVQSVRQTEESLSAYNLTVDNDHTYFVTGSDSTYGVWVHNNCWNDLDSFQVTGTGTENGTTIKYFIDDKGKFNKAYQGQDGRWYDPIAHPPSKPNLKDPARVPQQGSAIPYAKPVEATNGLTYKSNPKHTSGYGGQNGNLDAGLEPLNSLQLFEKSVATTSQGSNKRFVVDANGVVNQFSLTKGTTYHWSGTIKKSEYDSKIPSEVRKKLGVAGK